MAIWLPLLPWEEVTLLSVEMCSKKKLFWLVFLENKTIKQIFKGQSTGIGFLVDK